MKIVLCVISLLHICSAYPFPLSYNLLPGTSNIVCNLINSPTKYQSRNSSKKQLIALPDTLTQKFLTNALCIAGNTYEHSK